MRRLPSKGALRASSLALLLVSIPVSARILIVEIHYHPFEEGEDNEFVELYNDEPIAFDISGYRLEGRVVEDGAPRDGIAYVFPEDTFVGAHAALVVARFPENLAAAYGIDTPLGPLAGRLANEGEEVRLVDTGGSTVCRVRYNDRNRWPIGSARWPIESRSATRPESETSTRCASLKALHRVAPISPLRNGKGRCAFGPPTA